MKLNYIFKALLLLTSILFCLTKKTSLNESSVRPYATYLFKLFGVANGGKLSIDYSIGESSDSIVLLLVVSENTDNLFYSDTLDFYNGEQMTTEQMGYLCQQTSLLREALKGKGNFEYFFPDTDRYSVILLRCLYIFNEGNTTTLTPVSIDIQAHVTNPSGSELSIEKIPYIQSAIYIFLIYLLLLLILLGQVYRGWNTSVKTIHFLFLGEVFSGVITYLLYYCYMLNLDQSGEANSNLIVALQVMDHINSTLFLSSLLLISFGWNISRNFLSDKELRFASLTLGFYLLIGLLSSTCTDNTQSSICESLAILTYVIKTLLLLGIVIFLNFTITQLRTVILQSPWMNNILLQYVRFKQYSNFRLGFLLYLLLPTVVMLFQVSFYTF